MGMHEHEGFDVAGVGFGPSNLSLAIALEERRAEAGGGLRSIFFEKQPAFGWHRNMLLPSTTMQVSFLKDLTTFRNPVSPFSFISFLHASGRLPQFVNNQQFFPTRLEFHQYLEWAETRLAERPHYGCEVLGIRPQAGLDPREAEFLEIEVRDVERDEVRVVAARNVVVSTGLVHRMPADARADDRVWHSSQFLGKFTRTDPACLRSVAVVGAGQSAAEIARFLYDSLPHAQVWVIMPSFGYSAADDTPFANEIFDPASVDAYYYATRETRDAFWRYHKNTNYSVVDNEVIKALYQRAYDDDVRGVRRLNILNLTRVDSVKRTGDHVWLSLSGRHEAETPSLDVDALVCATGYDAMEPTGLLRELEPYCRRDDAGRYCVERDYRITAPALRPGIYLQGGTEHTHGLSASLLSNIAVRSGEILDSIEGRFAVSR